jgi:GT2 family glycosyltransferase
MARGAFLMFTDDDCRPRPGWAAAFLDAAKAATRPTMLGGRTLNAVAGDVYAQTSQDMNDYLGTQDPEAEPFFASNNIAVPRDAFLALGGFDIGYRRAAGEDRALCRDWHRAGHAFAAVEGAVLDHHHAMSLARFWRQHRNYGFGAARFHAQGEPDGRGRVRPLGRLGFYAGLVAAPLRGGVTLARLKRAGLLALAQVATAQGYREAWRSGDATR